MEKYWIGDAPVSDDFAQVIEKEFIEGTTKKGAWAFMTPESFKVHGRGFGEGVGQRYQKQEDGRWLKVEG